MKHLIIILSLVLTTTATVHACSCNATGMLHKVTSSSSLIGLTSLEEVHTNICADFVFDNLTLPGCWNVNWTRQNCTENPTSNFNFDVVMDVGGIEMYQCIVEIICFICMNNLWHLISKKKKKTIVLSESDLSPLSEKDDDDDSDFEF